MRAILGRIALHEEAVRDSTADSSAASSGSRLHIGCGDHILPGWINVDSKAIPGVDLTLDVRKGLPFENLEFIFAEHFLEHLSVDESLAFLTECRRALKDDGILRLSTPNLDWVMLTHYHYRRGVVDHIAFVDALRVNRAFRGWGHQFLYNPTVLTAVLKSVGFQSVEYRRYGESEVPALRGIEGHELSDDVPELPHVLVVEAWGRGEAVPLPAELDVYRTDVSIS